MTADILTSYFETHGYEVTTLGLGKDVLAFTDQIIPDLMILDIGLPDVDGYEVYRYLRTHRRTQHIPIVLLTDKCGSVGIN